MSAESPSNYASPSTVPEASVSPDPEQKEGGIPGVVLLLAIVALVALAAVLAPRFDVRGGSGESIPAGIQREQGTPSLPDPAEEGVEGATSQEEVISGVLRYAMEESVLQQAAVDLPISSECTPTSGIVYDCTVTFGGEPVHSTIEVEDASNIEVASGGQTVIDTDTIRYQVIEQETVVTKHAAQLGMLGVVADSQKRDSPLSEARCDADLPEVQVVTDGEDAEGHCYATPNGWRAWPNWTQPYDIAGHPVAPIVSQS